LVFSQKATSLAPYPENEPDQGTFRMPSWPTGMQAGKPCSIEQPVAEIDEYHDGFLFEKGGYMLITNGKLITWGDPNQILEGHAIHIADGLIDDIGPEKELLVRFAHDQNLDAGGSYVMPGNICAHTHFYGAFARGWDPRFSAERFPRDLDEVMVASG
jgi:hypothetical protein